MHMPLIFVCDPLGIRESAVGEEVWRLTGIIGGTCQDPKKTRFLVWGYRVSMRASAIMFVVWSFEHIRSIKMFSREWDTLSLVLDMIRSNRRIIDYRQRRVSWLTWAIKRWLRSRRLLHTPSTNVDPLGSDLIHLIYQCKRTFKVQATYEHETRDRDSDPSLAIHLSSPARSNYKPNNGNDH